MMNFYRGRRGLPILWVFYINMLQFLSIFFIAKMRKLASKVLKTNDREGYAKYLASLIYEYQLKLKYALEAEENLDSENQKKPRKVENCKTLNFNRPSTLIAYLYLMFCTAKGIRNNKCFYLFIGVFIFFNTLILPASYGHIYGHVVDSLVIKGIVQDKHTALPLEGVRVEELGSKNIVYSDQNGNYSISPYDKSGSIRYSLMDYETFQIPFKNVGLDQSSHRVKLEIKPDTNSYLSLGSFIPENLWIKQFLVFNHQKERTKISLNEFRNKRLLIIDFWAPWCKPCVEALALWDKRLKQYGNTNWDVLAVNVGSYERSLAYMQQRNWQMGSIYGIDFFHLNNYFFKGTQVGGQVWILDGEIVFIGFEKERKQQSAELQRILKEVIGGQYDEI